MRSCWTARTSASASERRPPERWWECNAWGWGFAKLLCTLAQRSDVRRAPVRLRQQSCLLPEHYCYGGMQLLSSRPAEAFVRSKVLCKLIFHQTCIAIPFGSCRVYAYSDMWRTVLLSKGLPDSTGMC